MQSYIDFYVFMYVLHIKSYWFYVYTPAISRIQERRFAMLVYTPGYPGRAHPRPHETMPT